MKKIVFILSACISILAADAQKIKIAPGTTLTNNGATVTLLNTDMDNDGNVSGQSGSFVFSGNATNTILGTGTTQFHSVQLSKTNGGKLMLQKNIVASGPVVFTGGVMDIGNQFVELKFPGGLLQNENENNKIVSTGTGEVFIIQNLNAPAVAKPGNLGISVSSSQNLGATTISRGHQMQLAASGDKSITRYFTVQPVNNTNLNATVRLNYLDAELNGLTETTLNMWRYQGEWKSVGAATKSANQNYVEQTGINELTRFTLGNQIAGGEFLLSNFAGSCKGPDVRLQWKTANEGHIKQYIVEKSTDGANWQVTTIVAVNPALQNSYNVLIAPGGAIHFRVKVEWVNGQATFSDPIKIDCNKGKSAVGGGNLNATLESSNLYENMEVTAGPNPTTDQVSLITKLPQATPLAVELRDMNGKVLWSQQWQMQAGFNRNSINLWQYPSGTYLIILQGKTFRKSFSIIKK
jgi:hypothetical protein